MINQLQQEIGMSNNHNSKPNPNQTTIYQIRLNGRLGSGWSDWFGGLTITYNDNDETVLTGPVIDQAELHGLLRKVRDLGISLISVNQVESGKTDAQSEY